MTKVMETFWNEAKAELAVVKTKFKVSPSPSHFTFDGDCYLVETRSLGDLVTTGLQAEVC
jgi:hypothetical protein